MNILNVPASEVEKKKQEYDSDNVTDKLDLFFKIGRDYMKKYKTEKVNIHSKEGQEQLRKIIFALTEELYEFANVLKNKSWAEEEYPVDEEHMTEEICDCWAFFIQLLLMLGFDGKSFQDTYIKKLVVNEFRLRSKY